MPAVPGLMARAGATALGLLALAGCGSMQPFPFPDGRTPNGEPVVDLWGLVRDFWRNPVAPEERKWESVEFNTNVTWITDDTARIEARGDPLTGIETPRSFGSLRLLARAAGESAQSGASRFKIVHLRDRNYATAGRLLGSISYDAGRTTHIGSYPDLAASRYDRAKGLKDRSAAPRAWTHPGLTAVVVYTDDAPTRRRPLFEVENVCQNLVAGGVME